MKEAIQWFKQNAVYVRYLLRWSKCDAQTFQGQRCFHPQEGGTMGRKLEPQIFVSRYFKVIGNWSMDQLSKK